MLGFSHDKTLSCGAQIAATPSKGCVVVQEDAQGVQGVQGKVPRVFMARESVTRSMLSLSDITYLGAEFISSQSFICQQGARRSVKPASTLHEHSARALCKSHCGFSNTAYSALRCKVPSSQSATVAPCRIANCRLQQRQQPRR